jgi:hypothetical protein
MDQYARMAEKYGFQNFRSDPVVLVNFFNGPPHLNQSDSTSRQIGLDIYGELYFAQKAKSGGGSFVIQNTKPVSAPLSVQHNLGFLNELLK